MTRIVLLTAFNIIILSTLSYSQNVFPSYQNHPTWGVDECAWTYCTPIVYKYKKDTTFCNQNYSELRLQNQFAYIRSDSLKTYVRLSGDCSEKEYLMYDYSMEIGDTVYVGYDLLLNPTQDTTMFVLESIPYSFGNYKTFMLKYDPDNQGNLHAEMYWEGGVGSLTHPFYSLQCLSQLCESSYELLCYDGSNSVTSSFVGNCDIIDATVSLKEQAPTFYPNPFQQKVTIEVDPQKIMQLEIFDVQGKQVNSAAYRVDKGEWLTIVFQNELAGGAYLVRIQTKEGISSILIMKE